MSMQVELSPVNPLGHDYPHEKAPVKQGEDKAAAAGLPQANSNHESKKAADIATTTQNLEHISLAFNRRLKFEIDHESREVLIKVIDNETDKVIKVLPPEELQRLHSNIRETMGFLFDQMA